ncbi:hypothetical protein NXW75_08640 [Bacteroides xylanisolvens]|nr:hypothetical protein [Bacteroides xylanisolvens]
MKANLITRHRWATVSLLQLDVSLGKWITPSYGVRLQYSGLKAKGLTDASGMYAKGAHRGYYKEEFNVSNLHADFMWNLVERFPRIQ